MIWFWQQTGHGMLFVTVWALVLGIFALELSFLYPQSETLKDYTYPLKIQQNLYMEVFLDFLFFITLSLISA